MGGAVVLALDGRGGAGGRALLWGSCWRRAMSALALLRCAWAASSRHHPATRRPPFPCCRFSRLSVANSVGGAAVPRVCEGGSAGLRRQAGTLPGYGDEGTCCPTLEAPNSLLPPPPLTEAPAPWSRLCLARGFPQGSPPPSSPLLRRSHMTHQRKKDTEHALSRLVHSTSLAHGSSHCSACVLSR